MTELIIKNEPDYAHDYEFVVAREVDGEYWFYGAYRYGYEADKIASYLNGVVFHNVRIQGKRK